MYPLDYAKDTLIQRGDHITESETNAQYFLLWDIIWDWAMVNVNWDSTVYFGMSNNTSKLFAH